MIKLPKSVLDTVNDLQKTNDPKLQTMLKLTQPREIEESWDAEKDYPVERNYERMWMIIERYEQKNGNDLRSNQWVLDFLDDVIDAQKLPEYMYLKNESRIELMVKVNSLVEELNDIFLANKSGFNSRLKKALDRKNLIKKQDHFDASSLGEIDIVSALNFHSQSLIKNISSAEFLSTRSKGI